MGKPVYRQWADVPATLATKTQLGPRGHPEGLRPRGLPAKDQPVVAYKVGMRGERYALYERSAAVAKRPATPAGSPLGAAALEAAGGPLGRGGV